MVFGCPLGYNPVADRSHPARKHEPGRSGVRKEDAMLRSRSILRSAAVSVLLVLTLSCGAVHDSDEFFVLVSANLQLPYWKAAGAGCSNAAGQIRVRFDFVG